MLVTGTAMDTCIHRHDENVGNINEHIIRQIGFIAIYNVGLVSVLLFMGIKVAIRSFPEARML